MSKIIVHHPDDWTNLNAPFLKSIWNKSLQIELYSEDKTYDPNVHIFCASGLTTDWYSKFHARGHQIIIDHLWDSNLDECTTIENNVLTLRCRNWIWYNESLWYKSLGYNNYTPNRNYQNSFLMLMNLCKPHRDKIFKQINLNKALYSYVGKNIHINNDIEQTGSWERYFNPDWYDCTSFSVVAESMITLPTFISEKTFKPLAYYHPFIVWGSPYTLQYLHELGFETFPHIINEDYDNILDSNQRLTFICEQVDKLLLDYETIFNDFKTQEILRHNHNLFFDNGITKRFEDEIVGEILKFIMQ